MVGTSYQILEVLAFCDQKRSSFNNNNRATFSGEKKYNEESWSDYFLTIRKKISINFVIC